MFASGVPVLVTLVGGWGPRGLRQRVGVGLALLSLTLQVAQAACSNGSANTAARVFYQQHARFYQEDPARLKAWVTPRLLTILTKEYRCAQGELCALEADPWLGAQDGKLSAPLQFTTQSESPLQAKVSLRYQLCAG